MPGIDGSALVIAKAIAKNTVSSVLGSNPETVDTLKDFMQVLDEDPDFVETVTTKIDNKIDKEEGMVLVSQADAEKLSTMPTISELGEGLELQDGVLKVTSTGINPETEYTFSGGSI